jgi:RNA polymerase sigma factor (sigma-70 family)
MAAENRWLALSIARSFPPEYRLKYDDRVSLGYMGLIHAVAHFNPSLGWKFSTYATRYIRGFICRELMNERLIQAPHYLSLAKHRGHRFRDQAKASLRVMSIHSRNPGRDRIPVDPRTEKEPEADLAYLGKIVDSLPKPQAEVVRRCVMGGETLQAVARDLGVTRERIRQIRNESMCRMKDQIKIIE